MMENKEGEKKRDKQLLDHKGRIREINDTVRRNTMMAFLLLLLLEIEEFCQLHCSFLHSS